MPTIMYQDFSGGLNTVHATSKMKNSEVRDLTNVDLDRRGAVSRRYGMVVHLIPPVLGKGQGYFRYYRPGGGYDEILAVGGKLYKDGAELPITGLPSFQTDKRIEAVQFQNSLYIATGTKLVEYDGTEAKVIVPYVPNTLDALYIGTNALSDNPDEFMQDSEALHLRLDGVTFSSRYGRVNEPVTLTAYHAKPASMTVEYQFEFRKIHMAEGFWEIGQAYSTEKTFDFTPEESVDYQFRVFAKEVGNDVDLPVQYLVPKYAVRPTSDLAEAEADTSYIHSCNRIILHWDRLIMYGDENNGDTMFISELQNPHYFPVPNTLRITNAEQEYITKIIRYRDELLAFTPDSAQAVFGRSPADFRRVMLNSGIGCIAPESVQVMENAVVFLSREGLQVLKSVGYSENHANTEAIDEKIENLVPIQTDACACVQNGQYHLVFPRENKRLRLYYELSAWTKDESSHLDFSSMIEIDGVLYGQSSSTGKVYRFDETVWDDDGEVYEDKLETKKYDLGDTTADKRLKEAKLLAGNHQEKTDLFMNVYADSENVLDTVTSSTSIDENGNVVWSEQEVPNISISPGTTFGVWKFGESAFGEKETELFKVRVSGKCNEAKTVIKHKEAKPNTILGVGYTFMVKNTR